MRLWCRGRRGKLRWHNPRQTIGTRRSGAAAEHQWSTCPHFSSVLWAARQFQVFEKIVISHSQCNRHLKDLLCRLVGCWGVKIGTGEGEGDFYEDCSDWMYHDCFEECLCTLFFNMSTVLCQYCVGLTCFSYFRPKARESTSGSMVCIVIGYL